MPVKPRQLTEKHIWEVLKKKNNYEDSGTKIRLITDTDYRKHLKLKNFLIQRQIKVKDI